MMYSLINWALSLFLAYSGVSLAVSAWKREGRLSGRSAMSLLIGLLETAALAGLFRLVVQWSPGTVALWVAAAAALATAVAGLVIRWPELSARARHDERTAPDVAGDHQNRKPRKKPKKEPGKAAVAGHAGFLAAVVAVSFAIG